MSSDSVVVGPNNGHPRPGEDRHDLGLASAVAVVAGAEREIDVLWRESVAGGDSDLSERLAELSHALRRAARSLEESGRAIG